MRLSAVRLLSLLFIFFGAAAQAQDNPPLRHPLVSVDVLKEEVTIGQRADGSPVKITLSTPKGESKGKLPVVLLMHGGIPAKIKAPASVWQVYRDWGTVIAASGAAAVMYDHSLGVPKRELDLALGQLDQVLAWLAAQGEGRGLDTKRVSAIAFSAGGLLAPSLIEDKRPLAITRIALFYPSTGIVPGSPSEPLTSPELAQRMSLQKSAAAIAGRKLPLLILRAGGDQMKGLNALQDETIKVLLGADAAVEVVNLPGAPHGFDARLESVAVKDAIDRAIAFATRD
ncbi:alpha/beta hydrolase family protein [Aestuariivirga sp. YIM B02566]|uniref:Alpha/beta hydrolase n=1 Tax=Taklimakanibacter albus TaxID=2800327 RepID=A0ACC5QXD6_9HYPH|nr:alpha/beta hydrolase [Aestuariivirga sp. YIM B02566]MBK1865012.1 alpha/beta hydrolase [Aestuariivirga sp. YIM B02566]